MPSDYRRIREDNVREYGEGTRHLAFLGRLYTDRTHFIFELLQNAEDAGASRVLFRLFDGRLEVTHNGRPFDERDVIGVCGVGEGTKAEEDLTQIGKFGIGFKSVYAYTSTPEIHSGDENFSIKNYVRPDPVERRNIEDSWTTLFVFEFNGNDVTPEAAHREIGECLRNLSAKTLLFLRKIKEIAYELPGHEAGVYLREENPRPPARQVAVIGQNNGQDEDEAWLIFERSVTVPNGSCEVRVEVGFRLEADTRNKTESITKINDTNLVVYFPTEKATRLGFLIQGPYRTTPARDNIPKDNDWNKMLVEETAELIVESLRRLKEMGLLSVPLLEALPIKAEDFPENSMFYPIFNRVRETLKNEALLPADDQTFIAARNAKLARGAELTKFLNQDQLRALFQSDNEIKWLTRGITQDRTPDLRSYLMNELDIDEVTPERFASNLSGKFLDEQTDEWFIRFYEFLLGQKALWRPPHSRWDTGGILRRKPILRLQDGTHVKPFRPDKSPTAYLAKETDIETSFPIVKLSISQDEETRKFLKELGIPELDIVAEVIEKVLPKYMADEVISDEMHKQDVSKIERAYKTDSSEKKNRLQKKLLETPFILARFQNGENRYCKPDQVYFETDELNLYFSRNDSYGFVDPGYPESVRALLENLGVTNSVRVEREERNSRGHVVIKNSYGCHERGIDGFDPDIKVDGLENALDYPSAEKSAFIWNKIAAPHSDCIRGVVERSSKQTYADSDKYEEVPSFGKLLIDTAWLPDSDGNLHKPSELALDDLPESFVCDEKLVDQLRMKKNVVAKLAEEAGISRENLERARQFGEASPEVKQQIDALLHGENRKQPQQQESIPFVKALSETFSKPGKGGANSNGTGNQGFSPNPSRRREKTSEEIAAAIKNEGAPEERFSYAVHKKWNGKNDQVRVDFVEWYGGRCQICEKTFIQKNGEPYFEGLYLVSYTTAEWVDRVGNVLCLCALHSAMFQFGPKEVVEDITQQVMRLKAQAEDGDGHPALRMKLCEDLVEIKYAEKHLIDLQEMIRVSQKSGH